MIAKADINAFINTIDDIQQIARSMHFEIRELQNASWEEQCFFITVEKKYFPRALDAFLALTERLEYHEQEWEYSTAINEQERVQMVSNFLVTGLKNSLLANCDKNEFLTKLKSYVADFSEYNGEEFGLVASQIESTILVFDEWNLYEVFGENAHRYFIFLWYTTA